MSTSPLPVNYGRIAVFSGTDFPVAYADPAAAAIRKIAATDGCTGWAKIVTDPATNFTSVNLQLVDSYDGSAGSWVPNTVNAVACRTDGTAPSWSGTSTIVLTVTAGKTYWVKLQTANTQMGFGGASIVAWGSGGVAKAGDSISLYLATIEGA